MVEQRTENPRVGSSILPLAIAIERLGAAPAARLCQRYVKLSCEPSVVEEAVASGIAPHGEALALTWRDNVDWRARAVRLDPPRRARVS